MQLWLGFSLEEWSSLLGVHREYALEASLVSVHQLAVIVEHVAVGAAIVLLHVLDHQPRLSRFRIRPEVVISIQLSEIIITVKLNIPLLLNDPRSHLSDRTFLVSEG